jgi:hypothetical protein
MVSAVSPAATVIAAPPFRFLGLAAKFGFRPTDPVIFGAVAGGAMVGLVEVGDECLRSREFRCGCGTCVVCVCEIGLIDSGLLLNRDVSALQAATPMVISASAAARGENREHNSSRTGDIVPY